MRRLVTILAALVAAIVAFAVPAQAQDYIYPPQWTIDTDRVTDAVALDIYTEPVYISPIYISPLVQYVTSMINVQTGELAACNFIASGPTTDPSSRPFHVEGTATYTGLRTVAATEIACSLRVAATGAQLGRLAVALPGPNATVAGSIVVRVPGPYQLCAMTNVLYTDGTESNPSEVYTCRTV